MYFPTGTFQYRLPLLHHSMSDMLFLSPTSSQATREGNHTRPQSSQLVEPLWTDPGRKSGTGTRGLIST